MGQVSAANTLEYDAAPERVLEALADYQNVRPRILPDQYLGYKVTAGGQGDGTVAEWVLKATEKRSRNVVADVTVSGDTITETDRNSSMVTKYRVAPRGSKSVVTVTTTWNGAGGIGGFFEGLFAPIGLKKIQGSLLTNLQRELS